MNNSIYGSLALDSPDTSYPGVSIVPKEIEWITTAEAAEIMGVAVRTVQNLCAQETDEFQCKKWGRSWMVDKAAAIAYKKSEGGRPPKTDTKS